jgi:glutamine amidotransferase|tara:strand:- start:675 stop:1310 length:636 start_codon:yes stop_codon:yes gene_type:complete
MAIAVVDYGLGNLYSLSNAFAHCGKEVIITNNLQQLSESDVLVLPGVGAFSDGMSKLQSLGIDKILCSHASKDKLILGICLGMQLLLESSEEFGQHEGLCLIKGHVKYFHSLNGFKKNTRVPHIGWNELEIIRESPLTADINYRDMYFAHSLCVVTTNIDDTLATSSYGNIKFASVIGQGSVFGCQFHPEKSSSGGLTFISNFIEMARKRI